MRRYAQYYKYDGVGNMLQMKHTTTGGTGNWKRKFDVATTSNKLLQSSIGSNGTGTESYTYDARGNMIDGMNHLLSMEYNDENRLEKVEITASITAYYQYDDDGQRVRKVIVNTSAATQQVRKYINDWEVYQKIDSGTNTIILERETLHIDDQDKRIALIDTPTIDTLSTGEVQLLRYQYCNNISTASLELDENAAVITYEEYYPYGNTSYQGGRSAAECSLKRYRYTGKERDEETGLNYHGARYYAPWLARWSAVDPLEWKFSPKSPFDYCDNNPVKLHDPSGKQAEQKQETSQPSSGSWEKHNSKGFTGEKADPFDMDSVQATGKKMGFFERMFRKVKRFFQPIANGIKNAFDYIFNILGNIYWGVLFTLGTVYSNLTLNITGRPNPRDVGQYSTGAKIGQFIGDVLTIVAALAAIGAAGALVVAGGAVAVSAGLAVAAVAGVVVLGAMVYRMANDSSANEKHGDGGRALDKIQQQIQEIEEKIKNAVGTDKKRLIKKKQRIIENAKDKRKGEEHSRTNKR